VKAFTVVTCEQRSAAWFASRAGKLTGSVAAAMLSTVKSGEAAARRDLRMRLALERITGQPQEDGYINAEMQRGVDLEPAGIAAYEALTGDMVETTGFLSHVQHQAGCSLDGHVGDYETLVSIKCPKSATHFGYLRGGVMPSTYEPQMLHELWITGAKAYDFLSYDDRFPEALRVFYVRTLRDEAAVEAYAAKALAFLDEVALECEAVRTMADLASVLREAVSA